MSIYTNRNENSINEKKAINFHQTGKIKEAEKIYVKLIDGGSKNHILYVNLASICLLRGDKEKGLNLLKTAFKLKPDYPVTHNNLGNALKDKGDLSAAISSYKQALKLKPNYPAAHYNLGNALRDKGDLSAAISSYKQALKLKPNYPAAHVNLGVTFQEKGEIKTAISTFKKALKLKPDYPAAHTNLGRAYLLNLDYQRGWLENEYRFKNFINSVIPHANPPIPKWQGEGINSKEKLLVVSEQGLGDTIQFMRYIPYLKQKGIDVSFCAQTKLHDLIKASGISPNPLTPEQGDKVQEGKWISLLSLPLILGLVPNNLLITAPYIASSVELIRKWREILSTEQKPIIGINWQGNPKCEKTILKGRSIPLETFSAIAKNHDCRFLSLQKGFGSEQLNNCSFKDQFVHCQNNVNEIWNFLETSAIIANCDLVVTSDTSVAHLAAGMGKPTWCLLQYVPDWRWGMNGEKTFWYPSMRLFRQKERNNWMEVIKKIDIELKFFL